MEKPTFSEISHKKIDNANKYEIIEQLKKFNQGFIGLLQ